ncbi:hypothetical protein LCGC14_0262550 [marine sediment metagenome]|uniref:Uncharacterized protein n=1 Tax=marine sediment metagenome TaxID=412755 RepID=A0A0F9WLQ8_9ZZZZ
MADTKQEPTVEEPVEEPEEGSEEESEEGTQETQEVEKPKPSNELKIVIILKDSKVMLGVQSPACDPVYETLEGTLAAALKRVPKLVEEAKTRWETSKLNPKCETPLPSQEQPVTTSQSQRAATPSKQPSMF